MKKNNGKNLAEKIEAAFSCERKALEVPRIISELENNGEILWDYTPLGSASFLRGKVWWGEKPEDVFYINIYESFSPGLNYLVTLSTISEISVFDTSRRVRIEDQATEEWRYMNDLYHHRRERFFRLHPVCQ